MYDTMERPSAERLKAGVSARNTNISPGSPRAGSASGDSPPSPPRPNGPLLADKAASVFRAFDVDGKNFLTRSDVESALAEMTSLHGLPAWCRDEALAQDPSSEKRDKHYSLHDFLSLNERLHSMLAKAARDERIHAISHVSQPPPGAESSLPLRQCFAKYCHLTLGVSRQGISDTSLNMNAAQLLKMCVDMGIAGERAGMLHQASVDIIFTKCKSPCSRRLNYQQWLQALVSLSEETGYDLFDVISSAELNFVKGAPAAAKEDPLRNSTANLNSTAHFQRFSTSFVPRMEPAGAPTASASATRGARPATAAVPGTASGSPLKPSSRAINSAKPSAGGRLIQSANGPIRPPTKHSSISQTAMTDASAHSTSTVFGKKRDSVGFGPDVGDISSHEELPGWLNKLADRIQTIETRIGISRGQTKDAPQSDKDVAESIEATLSRLEAAVKGRGSSSSSSQSPTVVPVGPVVQLSSDQMMEVIEQVMTQVKHSVSQQASEMARSAAVQAIRGAVAGGGRGGGSADSDKRIVALEMRQTELSGLVNKLQQNLKTLDNTRSSQVSSVQCQVELLRQNTESGMTKMGNSLKELEGAVHELNEKASQASTASLAAAVSAASKAESSGDLSAKAEQSMALMAQLENKLSEIDRLMTSHSKSIAAVNEQAAALDEAQKRLSEQMSAAGSAQAQTESSLKELDARLAELSSELERVTRASEEAKKEATEAILATSAIKEASAGTIAVSQNFADEQRAQVAEVKAIGDIRFANFDKKLEALQQMQNTQSQQVETLVSNSASDSTTLRALEDLVKTMATEIRATKSSIDKHEAEAQVILGGLSEKSSVLEEGVKKLEGMAAALEADVKQRTGELEASVTKVAAAVKKVEPTASSSGIAGMRAQIEEVKMSAKEDVVQVQKELQICKDAQRKVEQTVSGLSKEVESVKAVAEAGASRGGTVGEEVSMSVRQLAAVVQQMSADAEGLAKSVQLCAKATDVKGMSLKLLQMESDVSQLKEAMQKMEEEAAQAKKRGPQVLSLDKPSSDGPRDVKFASWDALKHSEQTLSRTCAQIREDLDKLENMVSESMDRMVAMENSTMESLDLKDKIIMRVVRQLDQLEVAVDQLADMQADD